MENERIPYRACPLCRSAEIRPFATVNCTGYKMWHEPMEPTITWVQCGQCQHVFTEGYFTDEALNVLWGNTQHQRIVSGEEMERNRNISAKMVERVANVIGLPNNRLWLDVGFGNGSLLTTAREFGFDAFGIDLLKSVVEDIQQIGISAYWGTLKDAVSNVTFAPKPTVISMADVVEHEPFPLDVLRSAREIINYPGMLLISMPNASAPLWHDWNATNQNPYWHEMNHYHNFTRENLYAALQQTGFEPTHYAISERYRCCMEVLAKAVEDRRTVEAGSRQVDVRLGASVDPHGLAAAERNPEDARSVLHLAQSYFDARDFVNARKWYARRAEMGGPDEEVYAAMFRIAESMAQLGEPWPDVEDAYLKAWEFRPTRAEPLYDIAVHYRVAGRYRLGHLFAESAAQIALPEEDLLFVGADVDAWRATDEQAICASWIGEHAEAFALCRRLLARPDIPDGARQRIAVNRDFSVPAMIDAASSYPDVLAGSLVAGPRDAEVTVTLVAGPDWDTTEQTLNSFLHCCTDVSRVGRFLVVDTGLSAQDRAKLHERYGFLEFAHPDAGGGPGAQLGQLREQIHGRFWLHLGHGWRFFAPENLITRLTAVLEAEAQVFQVGINFVDAVKLTGACAAEQAVRRTPDAGRYVLADAVASGPAMFDTARLDQAGGVDSTETDAIAELERRAAAAALQTASLDEVLCVTAI